MNKKTNIVCPHCHAVNAIPAEKDATTAKCGNCKKPLLTGAPLNLDTVSFTKMINRSDLPVVVDFWAPWCGPCKMMGPQFEQAAGQMNGQMVFAKLNTENEQQIATKNGIRGIPTMVLFRSGKEIARTSGAMQAGQIIQWVNAQL